jgi:hypothetical protein
MTEQCLVPVLQAMKTCTEDAMVLMEGYLALYNFVFLSGEARTCQPGLLSAFSSESLMLKSRREARGLTLFWMFGRGRPPAC